MIEIVSIVVRLVGHIWKLQAVEINFESYELFLYCTL